MVFYVNWIWMTKDSSFPGRPRRSQNSAGPFGSSNPGRITARSTGSDPAHEKQPNKIQGMFGTKRFHDGWMPC